MGNKPVFEVNKGANTEAITRETVMEKFTPEQLEELAQEKRRSQLPQLLLEVKLQVHKAGLTFPQLVRHAIAVGALNGFKEDSYSKPVYINPENETEVYKGSGPQPQWLASRVEAGHHYYEFRSDRPLRNRVWRNPENPKETWEGTGVMPPWLLKEMFWPKGGRKPRDYVLRISEEKE